MNIQTIQEDLLSHLPRRPLQEFAKGGRIYNAEQADERLYVVIAGYVKLSYTAECGEQTVNRIAGPEDLFGESAMLTETRPRECAVALERTSVMAWSRIEIESQIEQNPRLGVALIQYFASRSIAFQQRLQNMAVYKTSERVMLGLLDFSDALGTNMADGSQRLPALTHQTIAEYVGTSREIVSTEMNRLRRMGMVRYTRKYVDVYAAALREWMRQGEIPLPARGMETSQAA
jgi:CRP/FNR family cyclic AMP-dependent transcriptional regulator